MGRKESKQTKNKLERAVDGAPSQIPTLMFLTPPQRPQVSPPGHDPGNRMKFLFNIVFYLLFVRTHTKSMV